MQVWITWLLNSNEAWALLAQVELKNTLSDTGDDDTIIEDFSTGNNDNKETTGELSKANLTRQYH